MKEIVVSASDQGAKLGPYLQKLFPALPKSLIHKSLRKKKIKVNRKRAEFNQILSENDSILLFLAPDLLESRTREIAREKPLDIVYEDENLLIINKPAGLLSQKDEAGLQDSLNERLLSYLVKKGEYDPASLQAFTPSINHRLDRNTSGLVIASKNADTAKKISEAIANHKLKKSYLALVNGNAGELDGKEIHLYLKKEGTRALVSKTEKPDYLSAEMKVSLICFYSEQNVSLVECELISGRFHQIRASLAFLGYPLAKDLKYGAKGKGDYKLCAFKLDLSDAGLDLKPDQQSNTCSQIFEIKPDWIKSQKSYELEGFENKQ